jgi:divalent metal cation (Fe/Co/Zn/Cd) transporter
MKNSFNSDTVAVGCSSPARSILVRQAFQLEGLTVVWMTIEAGVATASGIAAGSLSLLAFGMDSFIELASAAVLVWRLSVELRRGRALSEKAERTASRICGALLLALAAYVVAGAAWGLWRRHGQEFSIPGLVITALAIPIMFSLARRKLAIAERLGSRALRADAVESIACGWLSFVVVVGLVAQFLIGAWWFDSVNSLAIVWLLVKEGHEAWESEESHCDRASLP